MSEFLTDLSAPSLIRAIEDNNFEFWSYYGNAPQVNLYDSPSQLWYNSDIPDSLFNGILRVSFTADDLDTQIDQVVRPFQSRQLPFMWLIGPATQPADLGQHLETIGLSHPFDLIGMAVGLSALNEEPLTPPGLTIELVSDQAALKHWLQIASESFGIPDAAFEGIFDLEVSLGFDQSLPRRRYLAYLDGKPVATSLVLLGAEVAGIYWVATTPSARGQGIGAAITLMPLREARGLGYRVGILHASPMGVNVYRRLGFQEYCRIAMYLWDGPSGHSAES